MAAVLTLTLCIGANSLMFSLIDAVLLRPLPYADPGNLVALFESNATRKATEGVAPAHIEDWSRLSRSFSGIAGAFTENLTDTSGLFPEKLLCARVSPGFFSVLGVLPRIGREFTPDEERFGGPNAVLITESFWRRRFAGDPGVEGKALRLNDALYPIAGVLPGSFRMPVTNEGADVWIPAVLPDRVMRDRDARYYAAAARLRPGISPAAAQADLNTVQAELGRAYPATDAHWKPVIRPLKEATVGGSRQGLWILFAAVGMVLLIGCANVACLLLTQSHRRAREMAIRYSLGARRGQIMRQLLWESFLIALPGSVGGLLMSVWGTEFLRGVIAGRLPRAEGIVLNWQVAGFTLVLGVLTTIVFGLLPALTAARGETGTALTHGSRTEVGGSQALLRLLVGAQVALAMLLLVGAGLLIRSMVSLLHVPLGFDTGNILTLHVSASWAEKKDQPGVQHRMQRTLQAIGQVPGVASAALALDLPGGSGSDYNLEMRISGRPGQGDGEKVLVNVPVVSASYFRTLGIPLLAGQMCREVIDTKEPQQAMVNRQFVDRFMPNESPVGHTLESGEGAKASSKLIVGVVGDTRDTNRRDAPKPSVYWCTLPGFIPDPIYLVKTQAAPMAMANQLRALLKRIEPGRAVYDLAPLEDQIANTMDEQRLETILLSSFGFTALLLASVGLYGVVGFYVSQRTREIGLRIALGARPGQVFRQVFRQGALLSAGGVAAGMAAGAILTRSVSSLLFGIGRWDPVTFATGPAVLLAVAALATWIPARRATEVEPMEALRDE